MATFNPYNKAVKESINVDYKDRHSAQKVILCNRENKFFGEFVGIAKINNIDVTGGQLANVNLSNVSIYAADGRVLHLSSLAEDLEKVVVDFPEISALARKNEDDIKTISAHNKNVDFLINEISAFVIDESIQRQMSDEDLSVSIVAERVDRRQADQTILNTIDEKWTQHNQDLVVLSNNVIDEVENIKHYSMVVPKSEPIDKFMLNDWSVNKIKHGIPYAYVNIQEEGEGTEKLPAGRITNVVYTPERTVSGFTFVVPQNCPVVELGASDGEKSYQFTTNNTSVGTDYYNYSLTWNTNTTNFQMTLNSGDQINCLSLAYDGKYVGRITEFSSVGADITRGDVFIQTPYDTELSVFDNIKKVLNAGESYTKERGEYSLTVTLSSNGVKLEKTYLDTQYQNLVDTFGGDSIGKVFRKDGVTYDDDDDDKEVTYLPITLSDDSLCELNQDNKFTRFLDENHDTAIRFNPTNDQISVRNENVIYSTPVFEHNTTTETPEQIGTLTFDVPNIETIPAQRLSSFTFDIPGGELSGTYKLLQNNDVPTTYRYDNETDSKILHFEYDTYAFRNFIRFTHIDKETDVVVRGRFMLNPTNLDIEDNSETVKLATLSRDSEGWLEYPDTDDTQEFILTADVNDTYYIPGGKKFVTDVVDEAQPKLYIHIPSKLPDATRAREFIIAVNVTSQSPKPVMVIPVYDDDIDNPTESTYKFIMNDMDVTNGLFLAKNRAVWKFMELEERCFVVEDLANTNLIHYINERLRGGVAYKGITQVVDDVETEIGTTPHLSNLFHYPESMIPRGWDYPRPEYRNENITLFTGNMFFVGKTEYTTTTRWEIEGVELEYGDYIVLKNDKKICEITSSDIDVIDTIEKDHIIVDDITVKNKAVINQISAFTEYAEIIDVDELSAKNTTLSNLTADNVVETYTKISYLTADNEFVNNLSGVNVSVETLDNKTADISSLTVTDGVISNLTVNNESVVRLSGNTLDVDTLNVSSETILSSHIDTITGLTANISTLYNTNADISNLTADTVSVRTFVDTTSHINNLNVSSEIVLSSDIAKLTGDNVVITDLTGTNVSVNNFVDIDAHISNLTAASEVVAGLTATNETVTNLTATEISVTKITADNLSVAPIIFKTEENNTVSILTGISETNGIVSVGAEPLTEKMVDHLCADLSTAYDKIHKKVWIDNRIQGVQEYSDISVVTLPKDEYEGLAPNWDPRTLYVVSSDYIDAYGGFIKNVKDGVDDQDAMNVRQVRQVSADLTTVISSTSSCIDTNLSGLSSEFMDLNWNYNKTLSASQVPSGSENWPNCLILRDYAEDGPYKDKKYVLKVLSGMLTITELTVTTPIF